MHLSKQIPVMAVLILVACGSDGGRASPSTTPPASTTDAIPEQTSPDTTTEDTAPTSVTTSTASTTASSSASPQAAAAGALPHGGEPFALDPANFTTEIDNPYWPMKPGTRWKYREIDADGDPLDVVVVVTNDTKKLANGITGRVVRDTVSQDGEIVEDTFDWYAQDRDGNIWYLGEDTAEFDQGVVVTKDGSWEAGVDNALPGVALPANPQPGMKYRQEYYAGHAEDNGEVLSVTEETEVPFGKFTEVLMTKDTSAIDTTLVENKFYAKGVGPVQTVDLTGGGHEELISVDQAPPGAGTGPLGAPNP
jgi:hypothetical protein